MKPKVLVVDDEQLVADTLCLIFQKQGFDCRATYSGKDAVLCAEEFSPELLLCDISMPEMDGLQVATSITGKLPDCRVLLLTGHYTNLKSARLCARSLKVPNHVMVKPVQPDELLQQAHTLLQMAG
ncbi:MAG TPA: response regulator [Acidobacteriaceae bacterium]|nr:response regulator [Acidobacteriaceae bacterium]